MKVTMLEKGASSWSPDFIELIDKAVSRDFIVKDVSDEDKITVEAHYFPLPFSIEKPCPKCGKMIHVGNGNNLHNQPVHLNGDNEIWLYCSDFLNCRHGEPVNVFIKCEGMLSTG